MAEVRIRPARDADIAALTAIYNQVIATSTAVFSDAPVDEAERAAWLASRRTQGYPVLVATAGEAVLGFASFGDFRAWPGYRFTVEHTVHVDAAHRGRGVGRSLVAALPPIAAGLGKHVMIAGVDADNVASLRLHTALGFQPAAHLREVGFKFGRFLDLVLLQRTLGQG